MDDRQIHEHIEKLVAEEHELWTRESSGDATEEDHRRAEQLKKQLDQWWDLLRQRRARLEAHLDPDDISLRKADEVEGYQQ
jgi:hypothetical protein